MRATFLTLSVMLIGLTVSGCATTSIYVLDKEGLVKVKAGDSITSKFDGWLLSQRAVNRVMKAKVEDVKLK